MSHCWHHDRWGFNGWRVEKCCYCGFIRETHYQKPPGHGKHAPISDPYFTYPNGLDPDKCPAPDPGDATF